MRARVKLGVEIELNGLSSLEHVKRPKLRRMEKKRRIGIIFSFWTPARTPPEAGAHGDSSEMGVRLRKVVLSPCGDGGCHPLFLP
jgi:hypothetical protein